MKIVITGANGSLGANLVSYFSRQGHEILATGLQKNAPSKLLQSAQYLQVDIRTPFNLPQADAIIHAAALSDDKAGYKDLYATNVVGMQHLVQAARHIPCFVHVSSSSVYLPQNELIKEEIAGKQNNKMLSAYGKSKLESEKVLLAAAVDFERVFVLRPRAFYGARDKMILPRLLKLEKNGVLQKPGSLDISISMTHYDNFNQAVELCLLSGKRGTHIYNVADDVTYNMASIVRKLITALYGYQLPEKEIPVALMKFLAVFKIGGITKLLVRAFTQDMVLDTAKIRLEMGYVGQISLEEKLPEIVEWVNYIGGVNVLKTAARDLPWR